MRWDRLVDPVDGLGDALDVTAGFDRALVAGLIRPSTGQVTALTALADAVSGTPLASCVAEAVDKVIAGTAADDHLAALAAARAALLGAAHDALQDRVDSAAGRSRPAWPCQPVAEACGLNLRAASRAWLSDLAIAGWRGIDHDLVAGSAQAIQALLADVRMRRLATLLDGFAAELAASCPGVTIDHVPVRRWADLWSRAVLLSQAGARDAEATATVTGRLLPLGVDLHEHSTAVQAQIHAVLEPSDGTQARLVRASVSAPKPDTIVGRGLWQLLRGQSGALAALSERRAVDIADMPITDGGDLLWRDDRARPGESADPFATARVQLAAATAAAVPPLERHPVRIAEPVLIEGYAAAAHDGGGLTFTVGGLPFEVDVDRLTNAGPLTVAHVATSTACIALIRWDAGRFTLQPLAVEATVKRKSVAVHGGAWAGGATDAAGIKAEAAAGDAVAVLRERAGRLLRS